MTIATTSKTATTSGRPMTKTQKGRSMTERTSTDIANELRAEAWSGGRHAAICLIAADRIESLMHQIDLHIADATRASKTRTWLSEQWHREHDLADTLAGELAAIIAAGMPVHRRDELADAIDRYDRARASE